MNSPWTKWIFSVAAVSIALNVVSNFAFRWIDRRLTGVSKSWKKRSKERRQERENIVAELEGNRTEQTLWVIFDIRRKVVSLFLVQLATMSFVLVLIWFVIDPTKSQVRTRIMVLGMMLLALLAMLVAINQWFKSLQMFRMLVDAWKQRDKDKDSQSSGSTK